mmetsp:Transcript_12197/g.21166  ORF Transcript_12197/g.21166 Transcript_12197/m.21166 type:complete len:109 (-) Transcript_12197:1481-1807(-)
MEDIRNCLLTEVLRAPADRRVPVGNVDEYLVGNVDEIIGYDQKGRSPPSKHQILAELPARAQTGHVHAKRDACADARATTCWCNAETRLPSVRIVPVRIVPASKLQVA